MNDTKETRVDPHATLLVVDDNPNNVAMLSKLLLTEYRILAATSGRRALELARGEPRPDLILLDVMMPEMDGYAVLASLREDTHTRGIPVIFITAMNATEDEEYGLEQGAADDITKPIRPAIVLARVRTQLELKRARDWLANQNAFLEEEVVRRMAENQIIQDVSIHALGCLAEMPDLETGDHIRRTQGYAKPRRGTCSPIRASPPPCPTMSSGC